jgi:hypothetical protein
LQLSSSLAQNIPDKYKFILNCDIFDYIGGADAHFFAFKLKNTGYHLILNTELDIIIWGSRKTDSRGVSFQEVFENIPSEIGAELAFHFDIFLKEKN